MNPIIAYLNSLLENHSKILTNKDKDLIKIALERTYGEKIVGQLGEFEFLRDTECNGKANQGKVLQLITDYIIWSHGLPQMKVSVWGYIPNHPLMEFIRNNNFLVTLIPETITHLIESQKWTIDKYNLDQYSDYIPSKSERRVNIE